MITGGGAGGGHRSRSGLRQARNPLLRLERLLEQRRVGGFDLTGC
jgi:hypothetical protein